MQYFFESIQPYGNDRHAEAGGNHADARTEPVNFPPGRSTPFRKDQHRKSTLEYLADVAERLPRAGFALGQWKRIEEQRRQVVVEAVGEPRFPSVLFRKEMRFEKFFGHRRGDAIAQPWRK